MRLDIVILILGMTLTLPRIEGKCGRYSEHSTSKNISRIKLDLQTRVSGQVVAPWDSDYEDFRAIHNRDCCQQPALIIRPRSHKDVSAVVRFSREVGLPISVRSGGHSYICTSLKDGGLHLDLRTLNKVKLVKSKSSETGIAAILGPGSTWGRVLDFISPEKYTIVHGQCLDVGVGGFILGGGVNALGGSARHGWGSENVIQMKVVLADGSFAIVDKDKIVIEKFDGSLAKHYPTYDTDLWFGLRGAGSSYGIVTEFLYTVHPGPETLPIVIPIYLDTLQDFLNIERASFNSAKYEISVYKTKRFNDGIFPYNLLPYNLPMSMKLGGIHIRLLNTIQRMFSNRAETGANLPVFLIITEVKGPKRRHTDATSALNYLKSQGIRPSLDIPFVIDILSRLSSYLLIGVYEDGFLTPPELERTGNLNIVASPMYGMLNVRDFAKQFLNHPIFGERSKLSPSEVKTITGCDFCWFSWGNFGRHLKLRDYSRVALVPSKEFGLFQWDLSCLFLDKTSQCPKQVRQWKESLSLDPSVPKISQYQYANTPSCEKVDFQDRYWGSHYKQLLKIKHFWDPQNVFHHCHSVGSSQQYCCPY